MQKMKGLLIAAALIVAVSAAAAVLQACSATASPGAPGPSAVPAEDCACLNLSPQAIEVIERIGFRDLVMLEQLREIAKAASDGRVGRQLAEEHNGRTWPLFAQGEAANAKLIRDVATLMRLACAADPTVEGCDE